MRSVCLFLETVSSTSADVVLMRHDFIAVLDDVVLADPENLFAFEEVRL